jgi:hypothetical protein
MRILVLLLALLSLPALAADHSPGPTDDAGPSICQAQSQQSPQQPQGHPGRYCCVHCRHNEVPCNGKCVVPPAGGKKAFCKGPPGCACPGKP